VLQTMVQRRSSIPAPTWSSLLLSCAPCELIDSHLAPGPDCMSEATLHEDSALCCLGYVTTTG